MSTTIDVQPQSEFELVIGRILDAPRGAVWRCWTEAALLQQWFCPRPWSVPDADFDLKPGGRFNTVFAGPDGERITNESVWLDIEPQQRLVFTDFFSEGFIPKAEGFMTGFVHLDDAPDGKTRFIWGARHRTAEAMQQHLDMGMREGWSICADQLEAVAKSVSAET